jgi:hypothetical protein
MFERRIVSRISRFEAARAALGHLAILTPDEVRAAVAASTYGGTIHPDILAAELRLAWWRAAKREHRPGSGLPMPVTPVTGDGDVLAEHTTCTGRTQLELGWVSDDPDDGLEIVLRRHTPIPVTDPGRLLLTVLIADRDGRYKWGTIDECPEDCTVKDGDHGEGIDLVSDPLPESWEPSVVQMAAWLEWQRPDLPEWACDTALRALREWARAEGVSLPGRRGATDRLRRTLTRLSELDGQLVHTPDAGTGPDWDRRNALVRESLAWATLAGFPVGWGRADQGDTQFPWIVYMGLPPGQVSWHVPRRPAGLPWYDETWDGHDRAEKARRIREWVAAE